MTPKEKLIEAVENLRKENKKENGNSEHYYAIDNEQTRFLDLIEEILP